MRHNTGVIVTRTAGCVCGGAITVVVPAETDSTTEAQEIHGAVARHNDTLQHQLWRHRDEPWLHPQDEGYPHEEVM